MSLVEKVSSQIKDALRARNQARLTALRNIRAAFLNEMKKNGADTLPDEVCETLLRRLEKQRRESIEAYEQGGRKELAEAERAELAVIHEFLPRLADEAQTRAWVEEAIQASGASGPRDLGKVMGALMTAHRGELDGKLARRLAAERLAAG